MYLNEHWSETKHGRDYGAYEFVVIALKDQQIPRSNNSFLTTDKANKIESKYLTKES